MIEGIRIRYSDGTEAMIDRVGRGVRFGYAVGKRAFGFAVGPDVLASTPTLRHNLAQFARAGMKDPEFVAACPERFEQIMAARWANAATMLMSEQPPAAAKPSNGTASA